MKKNSSGFIVFISVFLVLFLVAVNGNTEWIKTDTTETIILLRVDSDPDAPLHEIDEGVYGFFTESQEWITVLDFNTSDIIQDPYTWDVVKWRPGSMDK